LASWFDNPWRADRRVPGRNITRGIVMVTCVVVLVGHPWVVGVVEVVLKVIDGIPSIGERGFTISWIPDDLVETLVSDVFMRKPSIG